MYTFVLLNWDSRHRLSKLVFNNYINVYVCFLCWFIIYEKYNVLFSKKKMISIFIKKKNMARVNVILLSEYKICFFPPIKSWIGWGTAYALRLILYYKVGIWINFSSPICSVFFCKTLKFNKIIALLKGTWCERDNIWR